MTVGARGRARLFLFTPDVGGSLSAAGADFCVVWSSRHQTNGTQQVRSVTVTNGSLGSIQVVANGANCSISKTSGAGSAWLVCFNGQVGILPFAHCSMLNSLGIVLAAPTPLGHSTFGPAPDVAGDGIDFLVVWPLSISGDVSIVGQRVRLIGSPVLLGTNRDLITSQPGTFPSRDQRAPRVAGGGCRYVLTYEEEALGAGNAEIFMATMVYDTTPIFIDSHVSLSTVPGVVTTGGIAATTDTGDPGLPIALATFSSANVFGSLVDMLDPLGGVTVEQTGCGGILFEPGFTATGTPALGQSVTLNLTPASATSLPFIVLGSPTANPTTLCSFGCQQGLGTILVSVFGSSHTINAPCSAGLLGLRIATQGVEMLTSPSTHACSASVFGVPFRVSDTIVLRLR